MRPLNILVACEESQVVCSAFRNLGQNAFSCDTSQCSGKHPEWHIKGDTTPFLGGCCSFVTSDGSTHQIDGRWDLIVGHPPCYYTSCAGACRLYPTRGKMDDARYQLGLQAKQFFLSILNADCDHICVENPLPMKVFGFPQHSQTVQPWMFGHPVTKRTLLWLKDLPPLVPTDIVEPTHPFCPAGTSRKDRAKYGKAPRGNDRRNRSRTFDGLGRAMATQWTQYLLGPKGCS